MAKWLPMLRLVAPFFVALLFISSVPLVDAIFIARVGADQLVAFAFVIPATSIVFSALMGLGQGITAEISNAVGRNESTRASEIARAAIWLAVVVGCALGLIGLVAGERLIQVIGATKEQAGLAFAYFSIWSVGLALPAVCFAGSAALRGRGDIRSSLTIMMASAGVNLALDPILIFGLGPIPAMGIEGAALASVIAYACSCAVTLRKMRSDEILRSASRPPIDVVLTDARQVASVGVFGATSQLLLALSLGVATRLISQYGPDAVSALAVAGRVEGMIMVMPLALGGPLAPVIGMAWGGRDLTIVREGIRFGLGAGALWGAIVGGAMIAVSGSIAVALTPDPATAADLALALSVLPIGYAFTAATRLSVSVLVAIQHARDGLLIVGARTLVVLPGLAYLGGAQGGLAGMLMGIAVVDAASVALALLMLRRAVAAAAREGATMMAAPAE